MLDVTTDNALVYADAVLIPVQAEDSSIKALRLLLSQIQLVNEDLREEPVELLGLVVSLLRRPPSLLARSVIDAFENSFDIPVLTTVALAVSIPETWRLHNPVLDHAGDSEQAGAYRSLAAAVTRAAGL